MTSLRNIKLFDDRFGVISEIGPIGQLHTAEIVRILGSTFAGSVLDTSIWTETTANAGSVVVTGGEANIRTNTTANGAAAIESKRVARYISGISNLGRLVVQLGDTGVANNIRRWGVFDANNGAFFQLSGTTLSVVTRKAAVDTVVASGSWNGNDFTIDTNAHTYEIHYTTDYVYWIIDGQIVHTLNAASTPWSATPHLKSRIENTNSGGSTTDASIKARVANIMRFGAGGARPGFTNINTAGTSVLKIGPGTLDRIIINNTGTTSTFTIYDNTAASGTIIAVIDTSGGITTLSYDLDFNIGLTVVASSTPGDITVVYE